MAKEEKKYLNDDINSGSLSVISGIKFGFGIFIGFLAGFSIIILIFTLIYYISKSI